MKILPATGSRFHRRWMLGLVVAATGFVSMSAHADPAGDEAIVASLNAPSPGLDCTDAAAQTNVLFQFNRPPFAIKQISVYLDGAGVQGDAVDQHWPTVILKSGLHPGRNTVDVVATGNTGQTLTRRLVVLVGPANGGDDSPPARVACGDSNVASDDSSEYADSAPVPVVENVQPIIEEEPIYESQTVYYDDDSDGPVYEYHPYPVVVIDPWVPLIPFFAFDVFYSHYHPYHHDHDYHGARYNSPGEHDGWHSYHDHFDNDRDHHRDHNHADFDSQHRTDDSRRHDRQDYQQTDRQVDNRQADNRFGHHSGDGSRNRPDTGQGNRGHDSFRSMTAAQADVPAPRQGFYPIHRVQVQNNVVQVAGPHPGMAPANHQSVQMGVSAGNRQGFTPHHGVTRRDR